MFDCALADNKIALLGPRPGRFRAAIAGANVTGVVPLHLPYGDFWLAGRSDGVVEVISVSALPAGSFAQAGGWVRISITGLTANQTGVGTTNGTAKTLSIAQDMSGFGIMALLVPQVDLGYTDVITADADNNTTTGTVTLQGLIGGVWTDLYRINVDQTGFIYKTTCMKTDAGAGSLTQVRLVTTVSAGAGTISGSCEGDIYLFYGSEKQVVTAT